ncbi:MAG: fumarate reductase/succinate dehydrogenase flavoprotein subunit, partial [Bacteroidota bacterium]
SGLEEAIKDIKSLREDFWDNVRVPGVASYVNSELEKAGRVADYLELGELMCWDALTRDESCGAHFREEYQTAEGEALRDDEQYSFISCWEHAEGAAPILHKEPLHFEEVKLISRDYK